MNLELYRVLIDFGFVILIWAVQLVIYPSFGYYSKSDLVDWHRSYTKRVTIIVLPLMLCQLVIVFVQLWQFQNWYTLLSIVIVALLWLQTFLIFVPLHQSIDTNKLIENVCKRLVRYNWIRTMLWTLLFFISLIYYSGI